MTITEIARLAGVSVSTVSKIVNHKDESISDETRERVLAVVKEYNYRPYASAVAPTGRLGAIGVLIKEHAGSLAQGIISRADELGYSAAFRSGEGGNEAMLRGLDALVNLHVDGLVIDGVGEGDEALEVARKAEIPYVLTVPSEADPSAPIIDYEALGYSATQALARRGHRRIACLLGRGARVEGFYQGYRRCLFDLGLTPDDGLVFSGGAEVPIDKIAAHAFTGIVTSHHTDALRLYEAAQSLHYDIPYDLSVVSLKASEEPVAYPAISSIQIPRRAYGGALVDCLVARLERTDEPSDLQMDLAVDSEASIDVPYTSRAQRVIVVGSINVDNYLAFEHLPHPGATVTTPDTQTFPGGKCLNEAIGLSRLDVPVVALGRVGDDADADYLFKTLTDSRVDAMGIRRTRDSRTGQAYVFVPRDGNSMISIMSGANAQLTAEDIRSCERLFEGASYCLVNTEVPLEAAYEALKVARAHGATTLLKPSSVDVLPRDLLGLVSIVVPNQSELAALCPQEGTLEARASWLLDQGVEAVVVTCAEDGCVVVQREGRLLIPAIDAEAIDSTGAGDAFVAALTCYLQRGYDLRRAARIANYAAGLSVTRQGASAALVDRATLEAFVRKSEPELLT